MTPEKHEQRSRHGGGRGILKDKEDERELQAQLNQWEQSKTITTYGRFVEICWKMNPIQLQEFSYLIELELNDSKKTITYDTKEPITRFKIVPILKLQTMTRIQIGFQSSNTTLPHVYGKHLEYYGKLSPPRLVKITGKGILLEWNPCTLRTIQVEYAIEKRTTTKHGYLWNEMYRGVASTCVLHEILPSQVYAFRLVIVNGRQTIPNGIVGIGFIDIPHGDKYNKFNKAAWASKEMIVLTTPVAPRVYGIGTLWQCSWDAPNDADALVEELLYEIAIFKHHNQQLVYSVTTTTLETEMMAFEPNVLFDAQVKVKYQSKDYDIESVASSSNQFKTSINRPTVLELFINEADVVWEYPDSKVPSSIVTQMEHRTGRGEWQSFPPCEGNILLHRINLAVPDTIHEIRMVFQHDQTKCYSPSLYVVSPVTVNVFGIGTFVRLEWKKPLVPEKHDITFQVLQQLDTGETKQIYNGPDTSYFPVELEGNTRYYFAVVACLNEEFKSFPKMHLYSTKLQASIVTQNIAWNCCTVQCQFNKPTFRCRYEYVVEMKDCSEEWDEYNIENKELEQWTISPLLPHTLYHVRASFRITFSSNHMRAQSQWQYIEPIQILTPCDTMVITTLTPQSLQLEWKNSPTSIVKEISYLIEKYDMNEDNFIAIGTTRQCSFAMKDLNSHCFYCVRLVTMWNDTRLVSPEMIALTKPAPLQVTCSNYNHVEINWQRVLTKALPSYHKVDYQCKVEIATGPYGKTVSWKSQKRKDELNFVSCYSAMNRNRFINRNLVAFTTYYIQLETVYGGHSCHSDVFTLFTGVSAPGIPPNFLAHEIHIPSKCQLSALPTSFLLIQWDPPKDNGSSITGYALEMASKSLLEIFGSEEHYSKSKENRLIWRPTHSEWQGVYVGKSPKFTVDMHQLKAYGSRRFFFRLQAANEYGFSDYTNPIFIDFQERDTLPDRLKTPNITISKHRKSMHEPIWKQSKIKQRLPVLTSKPPTATKKYLVSRGLYDDGLKEHRCIRKMPKKIKSSITSYNAAAELYEAKQS